MRVLAFDLERLPRAGAALFALVLLVSVFLKSLDPTIAASSLLWTGLDQSIRQGLVDSVSIIECVVAGLILFVARSAAAMLAGGALAGMLLVFHGVGMIAAETANCGCFGAVAVPDWLSLAILVVGLSSCGLLAVRKRKARIRTVRRLALSRANLGLVLAVTCVSMSPRLAGTAGDDSSQTAELLRTLGLNADEDDALILLGSWSCDHCRRALADFTAARETSPDLARCAFFFVTRDSEKPVDMPVQPQWVTHREIPDRFWWELIVVSPPSFVRVRPGVPAVLVDDWPARDLRAGGDAGGAAGGPGR